MTRFYCNSFFCCITYSTHISLLQIVDVETGRSLGLNQPGEVWVRGPQASLGYLNLPAQTKEMFLDDGWIRTGNLSFIRGRAVLL